ncbi:MAG: 4-(cytidine 5'-diphospho)-2-C-methyl-D-erythritol kinase [Bacteroidales bacterium]|nr:4-(cytidine 5'-diphospho)-2-C-methyl-D-erythritol kinase [Bacteroidales bacterium]
MLTRPNCKINLGLHVMRRREDGYHDLETVFLPVPLCDELEINPAENFSFSQTGIAIGCNAEDNIVVKAFRLLKHECASRLPDVEIHLHKHIPFGAGLGGGSSDAAFTLRMLNEIYDLGFNANQLCSLAAKLGADCAFFIDNEPAYATGIGDKLTPLGFNPLKGYKLLMVKPDEAVSTAEAYGGILPRERRSDLLPCDLTKAVKRPITEWKSLIINDFEETVFRKHPRLEEIKEILYANNALYAAMSGSGATIYGIFDNNQDTNINFNANCNVYTFNL